METALGALYYIFVSGVGALNGHASGCNIVRGLQELVGFSEGVEEKRLTGNAQEAPRETFTANIRGQSECGN